MSSVSRRSLHGDPVFWRRERQEVFPSIRKEVSRRRLKQKRALLTEAGSGQWAQVFLQTEPSSGQDMGTPTANSSLVGRSRNHGDIPSEDLLTSRIMETYPYIRYFMSQSKYVGDNHKSISSFPPGNQKYLEEWSRKDKALEKKFSVKSR